MDKLYKDLVDLSDEIQSYDRNDGWFEDKVGNMFYRMKKVVDRFMWTPANEECPWEGKYLVTKLNGKITTADFNGKTWMKKNKPIAVIAWMELPDPFKEDK